MSAKMAFGSDRGRGSHRQTDREEEGEFEEGNGRRRESEDATF